MFLPKITYLPTYLYIYIHYSNVVNLNCSDLVLWNSVIFLGLYFNALVSLGYGVLVSLDCSVHGCEFGM